MAKRRYRIDLRKESVLRGIYLERERLLVVEKPAGGYLSQQRHDCVNVRNGGAVRCDRWFEWLDISEEMLTKSTRIMGRHVIKCLAGDGMVELLRWGKYGCNTSHVSHVRLTVKGEAAARKLLRIAEPVGCLTGEM